MSNPEQHVTSLEISKRMGEAGFEQESIFCWLPPLNEGDKWTINYLQGCQLHLPSFGISAYLSSEVGLMIHPERSFKEADAQAELALHLKKAGRIRG